MSASAIAVSSAGSMPMGRSLAVSSHLHLSDAFVYHKLFGNFARIDREMRELLERPARLSGEELIARVGPDSASLLWDSYFLVESPDEEREMIGRALDERRRAVHTGTYLRALQISSSNACNFACTYCFADASDRRSAVRQRAADGPQNISYELAEAAVREVLTVARRNGNRMIGVKFLGREPLINWRVMRRLMETFSDGSVQWSVTTNGSLITPEIAADLKRFGVLTVVSLDGPAAVNDTMRPAKSGGGTYGAVERSLGLLADAGVPFGVSSVLTADGIVSDMDPFIDHVADLGARELELTLVMQTRHNAVTPLAGREALIERLCDLYDHASDRGLLVHGDWIDPFHRILSSHRFRGDEEGHVPVSAACTATSHQISLEPTGDLFPCRAMSTHYGNIADLDAALHHPEYERVVMRTYHNVPACHGCELEGFCQGTCLGSSEEATGDVYGIDERYCHIYRAATEELLRRMAGAERVDR